METRQQPGSGTVPLVIVHFGKGSFCLKYALKSAAKHSNDVWLVGDASNSEAWDRHANSESLDGSGYERFCESYVHRSTNTREFELACFKRFFYLAAWMRNTGRSRAILLDSDIVSCADLSSEVPEMLSSSCLAAYMRPTEQGEMQWTASPHVSYWTIEGLESFIRFCVESSGNRALVEDLERKWNWHRKTGQLGGICDMTYLFLWGRDRSDVESLCPVRDERTLDFSINVPHNDYRDEYRMFSGVKSIRFRGGKALGFNRRLRREVQFLALHCQARNKSITAFLYYKPLQPLYWTTKPVYLAMRTVVRAARRLTGGRSQD
jgi:hypothetical protein